MEQELTEGPFGPCLKLRGNWSPKVAKLVRDRGVEELWLTGGRSDRHVDYVCEVPHLKALTLIHFTLDDPSPIECLHELRYLNLTTYSDGIVDFSNFPHLEECLIEWTKGVASALGVTTLRKLFVNRLPKARVVEVAQLTNLIDLGILSCGAESLEPLRNLKNLEKLRLGLFRKLKDIAFLSSLTELKELWIQSCSGFGSLEPLRDLAKLEDLFIENSGPFESLKPLAGLTHLRKFGLTGRKKKVLDGDDSPVSNLPNLEKFVRW